MRYRAFFSYSRKDDKAANWLHRQIDSYRTPKALVGTQGKLGKVPPKLFPIYRDRTDSSGGGELAAKIEQALGESESLIVLCSPEAVKSPWVDREVAYFLQSNDVKRVFPIIAPGLPDTGDVEAAYYPQILRGRGILAADLRSVRLRHGQLVGDGRETGLFKLLAGLLGVELDQLLRRERRRQRRLMILLSTSAILFAALAVAAGGLGWIAQERAVAEQQARALASANEQRALKGEAEAKANARLAEERAVAEKAERERADFNAEQAKIQELAARQGEAEAFNALARIFAERGRQALERGEYLLAARYALAGWRVAPSNEQAYRGVLGRVLHDVNESRPLLGHAGSVNGASFSPDGTRIVTCGGDAVIRIWDVASGRQLAMLRGKEQGQMAVDNGPGGGLRVFAERSVSTCAFSTDGARILSVSAAGWARVWDVAKAAEYATLTSSTGTIVAASFGKDATQVITVSVKGYMETRSETGEFSSAPMLFPQTVEIGSDPPGAPPPRRRKQDPNKPSPSLYLRSAALSSDGALLATQQFDNEGATVFDTKTGAVIVALASDSRGAKPHAFSRDASTLLVSQGTGAAVVDAKTGKTIATIPDPASEAAFSPDGQRVATAVGPAARVWDAASGKLLVTLSGHQDSINQISFSGDGLKLVTASSDGSARVWDLPSGREAPAGKLANPSFHVGPTSADGTRVVMIPKSSDETPAIWDAQTRREIVKLKNPPEFRRTARFSPDGRRVLMTAQSNRMVYVWDAATGNQLFRLTATDEKLDRSFDTELEPRELLFTRDSRRLFTVAFNGYVRQWDMDTGKMISAWQVGTVASAVLSPDEKTLAIGGYGAYSDDREYVATLWDVATGKKLLELPGHGDMVSDVAFSPDGKRLATAAGDGAARLWDLATGREIVALRVANTPVYSARFSPDGSRVVTASRDRIVRLWDSMAGTEVARLAVADDYVVTAGFADDGSRVLVRTGESGVRSWGVGRLLQPMPELAAAACSRLLLPGGHQKSLSFSDGRRFTQLEVASDPLIRDVWLRDHDATRDVCEGVAGALKLNPELTPAR